MSSPSPEHPPGPGQRGAAPRAHPGPHGGGGLHLRTGPLQVRAQLAAKERGEEPQPRFLETTLAALEDDRRARTSEHPRESYG